MSDSSPGISLDLLDTGPQRPVHARGPRSLEAVRMLRISVTDRCNLRCRYCMPAEGVSFEPRENLLGPDRIVRIASAARGLGIDHFKITGGEPTIRRDLPTIVEGIAALTPTDLSMTTNGIHLPRLASRLRDAGLTRVTVSVDSLRSDRYREITGGGRLELLWAGLEAAEATFGAVKLNVVVVRGVNDDEVVDFTRLAIRRGWTVRFIEFMPLGSSTFADRPVHDALVPAEEIAARIADDLGELEPIRGGGDPGVGPARLFRISGSRGRIGFIHAMSRPFCESCNRLRLTADGRLRSCLFDGGEVDLRPCLDGPEEGFREAFERCTALKPEVHGPRGDRAMSSIGG